MSIQALKDYIEENKQIWSSPIHGINHWEHVWTNGKEVGRAVDADLEVVEYFAYLHDCQRWSEEQIGYMALELLNLLSRTGIYLISANHNSRNWSAQWPVTPS